jgi:hypothetical protein
MARAWCKKYLSPGDWILEPFGANPMVPIEIAAAGFPIIVTANNPILSFMLQVIASAPQKDDFVAVLQDLAVAPKGQDRMEPYIRSLYTVTCAACKHQIEAGSFLWEKGAEYPFAAQVECPYCGAVGDQDISDSDKKNLRGLPPIQLHQARALNRIVTRDDMLRSQVMNALNAYPARPLIVLQTIINKLDSLEQSARHRELLIALILSAADQGNTLWAHPSPRSRPRQIVVPNIYQEQNLWKVMEDSIEKWQVLESPIPVHTWGEKPLNPEGIHLFSGRIRELTPTPERDFFSAILGVIPRPNQAFWTLSALWTGWIWGQESVTPIRKVLSRQRYDWNWHTNALKGVFDAIKPFYHPQMKLGGLIAENEPMLLLATLLAAETSGYRLSAFSQSIDNQIAQCYWDEDRNSTFINQPKIAMGAAKVKVKEYLQQKGEPADYQQIHAAAVSGLASEDKLAIEVLLQNPNTAASETQKWVDHLFSEERFLIKVGERTASIESGDWWLGDPQDTRSPLIDRIENKLLRHLFAIKETSAEEIKKIIYHSFPGIYTPEDKVILNCLESYAELIDPEKHLWKLREKEDPLTRQEEVAEIQKIIMKIGKRLNFNTLNQDPLLWFDEQNTQPNYSFYIFSTAIVSKHINENPSRAQKKILVFPGSRANLLAFKKQRDPVLAAKLDQEFLAVKFRLIRDLEANPLLSRELFIEQIQVDPPEYQASQLALF